jgi:hypothetical protein
MAESPNLSCCGAGGKKGKEERGQILLKARPALFSHLPSSFLSRQESTISSNGITFSQEKFNV